MDFLFFFFSSSRAFMLRLILPSFTPMIFTFTSSPTFNTSEGDLIRFKLIWEMCTSRRVRRRDLQMRRSSEDFLPYQLLCCRL